MKVQFTTKKDGYYSFGMFNNLTELDREKVKFIEVPYKYQELAIPETPLMVTETFSTAALSQATITKNNQDITYGIVADPTSIENRWVYNTISETKDLEEQANFGLTIVGDNLNVQPGLFAPIMGSVDSVMKTGKIYSFTYRPTTTVSEVSNRSWYDNYYHVIKDILKIKDYRENYFSSMTDAIFNMYELLMNAEYSGWSEDGKANYNMEARNIVSSTDPLEYIQMYLLTEDEEIYNKRTLPTIEYLLSRNNSTSDIGEIEGSSSAFTNMFNNKRYKTMGQTEIGGTGMGNSVYTGAYLMAQGKIPQLRNITAKNIFGTYIAQANKEYTIDGQKTTIKNPSEYLWRYKITKNQNDLENAIKYADAYVLQRVNGLYDGIANDSDFIYKEYFPNFNCLLEMYEELKDSEEEEYRQKADIYLEAAQESAKRLLTTLWSTGMTTEEISDTELEEMINENIYNAEHSGDITGKYYKGDTQDRLGYTSDSLSLLDIARNKINKTKEKYTSIPKWVMSRIGIGIEQTSTFTRESRNILMSTWAPDLMRLAEYLGEEGEIFEIYARNAIIGRAANYPGYYENEYNIYSYLEDYPYSGPDTTNIYYHHIPAFLAAIEDFLFSQSINWSNSQINFKNTRSQGSAWFSNRHYGYTPGTIFEEEDMWLWLKEGLINIAEGEDSKQIDWYGARKDGRVCFVLMNEKNQKISNKTITFDENLGIQNGTVATIYTINGKQEKTVNNNQLSIDIEGKSLIAIALDAQNVTSPEFAEYNLKDIEYSGSTTSLGETIIKYNLINDIEKNTFDVNANIIQINPSSYELFVYSDRGPSTEENGISKIKLLYKIEEDEDYSELEDENYPFEISVPNIDRDKKVRFKVELTLKNGEEKTDEEHILYPYDIEEKEYEINENEELDIEEITSKKIINKDILEGNSIVEFENNKIKANNIGKARVNIIDEDKTYILNITVKETIQPVIYEIPTAKTGLVYNGQEQIGVENGSGYEVTNGKATNAGNYIATVKLINSSNSKWSDGTTGDKTIEWTIAKLNKATVTAENKQYVKGQTVTGITGENVNLSGDISEDKVGQYTATATPDKNHTWSDGTTDTKTLTWKLYYLVTYTKESNVTSINDQQEQTTTEQNITGQITLPTITVAAGYTGKWYNGSTEIVTPGQKYQINDNITLTAKRVANEYTANFNSNGGTTANPATITKQYGAKLGTLPTTSKEGYIFKGWFTSQTGGSQITADTTMPINGATYYAHWEEEPDEEYIDLSQYQVDENKKYIEKISPKTNYQEFMNSIPTNMEVRINNKHDNDIIKTGDKLIVTGDNEEKEYTLIVAGDVNKDGLTEIRDIFAINSYRRKKGQLEEICIKAGDVNEDRQTDIKDIFKINSYRRGKIKDI